MTFYIEMAKAAYEAFISELQKSTVAELPEEVRAAAGINELQALVRELYYSISECKILLDSGYSVASPEIKTAINSLHEKIPEELRGGS